MAHFHWPFGFLVLMLPHDTMKTHLPAAPGNYTADVVGSCYVIGLIQVSGNAKFFCGCLDNTEAIVVSDIGRCMPC